MLDKKNFYINGQWVSPKQSNDYKVIDPSTEEECAVISLGGVEDVNDAVGAAKKAFETWAFSSKEERLEYLEALYAIYKKRWADMAQAISLEMGAPIDFSTQLQAGTGASHNRCAPIPTAPAGTIRGRIEAQRRRTGANGTVGCSAGVAARARA